MRLNSKTLSALGLLCSAAVLCNVMRIEFFSAHDGGGGGDRVMLSIPEKDDDDRYLMISADVLRDELYVPLDTPGACTDAAGQSYDHASNTKGTLAMCAKFCAAHILFTEHRGFNYDAAAKDCQCLFDDHKIPRPLQKKSSNVVINPHGTGPVVSADASGDGAAYVCYKKNGAAVGDPLDHYSEKPCDVNDLEVLDYVAFTAFEPNSCAELCGRFCLLETHRGFTVTVEGHCRCLFKEGELPTERKMSNSGGDRFVGGYSFSERFQQFITPAETKCYDRVDTMGTEPVSNQLSSDPNNHVFINEFHFRNQFTNEPFVRVVGPKDADASIYKVVSYQGRDGTIHDSNQLTGTFASSDDHPHFGSVELQLLTGSLRNGKMGADGLAVVNGQTGECLHFISYASEATYARSFMAREGECDGAASVPLPMGITEARDIPVGKSLQLRSGSGNTWDAFAWSGPYDVSTGTENAGQTLTAI